MISAAALLQAWQYNDDEEEEKMESHIAIRESFTRDIVRNETTEFLLVLSRATADLMDKKRWERCVGFVISLEGY